VGPRAGLDEVKRKFLIYWDSNSDPSVQPVASRYTGYATLLSRLCFEVSRVNRKQPDVSEEHIACIFSKAACKPEEPAVSDLYFVRTYSSPVSSPVPREIHPAVVIPA
jgi:hypothetical protein